MAKITNFFTKKTTETSVIKSNHTENYFTCELSDDEITRLSFNTNETPNNSAIEKNKVVFDSSFQFNQPIIDFPSKTFGDKKRKFNPEYYKKFYWLEYDISTNSLFCGICRCFNDRENDKVNFKTVGCSDWKNIAAKCSKHQDTSTHKTNSMLWLSKKNQKKSCAALLNSHHENIVSMNRKNLKKIIKTVYFISKQGLAFRGHDESVSSWN